MGSARFVRGSRRAAAVLDWGMQSKTLIFIPARLGSTRLPKKPLIPLGGVPMVVRTYRGAKESGIETYVVTDSKEIENTLIEYGVPYVMVEDEVNTGSERVEIACRKFDAQYVVNVQGDEPLCRGNDLRNLVNLHQNSKFDIFTLMRRVDGDLAQKEWTNPNVVKIELGGDLVTCLDFFRLKDTPPPPVWYQHLGIYSYKREALKKMVQLPRAKLEVERSLEQLRALANGMTIGATLTNEIYLSVDTPEDVIKVENYLSGANVYA